MDAPRESALQNWLAPNSTLKPAIVSSLLCWLAFPPVGYSWLVWVAPIGWLSLVLRQPLCGKRPYRAIWLAGFVYWVLAVHWIRLPHPANYAALVVLASYLGCYLPAFVALARVGVHRLRLPLWLVAPTVWTGLDWGRHHLLTGFGFGSLAHTQAECVWLIQIANVCGEYGVTYLVLLVAASITQSVMSFSINERRYYLWSTVSLRPLVPAIFLVSLAVGYGALAYQRHNSLLRASTDQPGPRIALIQGNTLADWKGDLTKQQMIMQEYMQLSLEAGSAARAKDGRDVDLFVWPETTFRQTLATVEAGYQPPAGLVHDSYLTAGQRDLAEFVRQTSAAILTGITRVQIYPTDHGHPDFKAYNSSVLMDSQQQILGTYDKMHRVIFGEYIPFADWFPALNSISPLTGSVSAGEQPTLLEFRGLFIAPNICYETCVPHLIRQHVNFNGSVYPDVLVNLTNDSWYWGSSELDMHLACGVFRAIENNRPLLIAANGGLSAHIGPNGTVHQVTDRQSTEFLLVDLPVSPQNALTFYTNWGDWFAGLCVVCCLVLAILGWSERRSDSQAG